MSTMHSQSLTKKTGSPKDGGEDEDDVGALIYREVQLRKAEAATAAAESKKDGSASSAATHRRTSTWKRSPVKKQGDDSLPRTKDNGTSKRKRKSTESSLKKDRPRKMVAKKEYRYECSTDGCTNQVVNGGVCKKHGAKTKRCSSEGCTNQSQQGGVCIKHGAKVKIKQCSSEGCTNYVIKGGVCIKHGAQVKRCSSVGCTNRSVSGGVCMRHGAKVKRCSSEGCTNHIVNGGLCVKHGAKVKQCSSEGCTNQVKRGGVCRRHGTYRNTQDESTAFGSEYENTTATRTFPNQHASRSALSESERMSVPGEVTILCQEILEV